MGLKQSSGGKDYDLSKGFRAVFEFDHGTIVFSPLKGLDFLRAGPTARNKHLVFSPALGVSADRLKIRDMSMNLARMFADMFSLELSVDFKRSNEDRLVCNLTPQDST